MRRQSKLDGLRPYVHAWRRVRRREVTVADVAYARAFSFSQFGEDMFLARYFGGQPTGFYVDVGAFDPFDVSNTLLLYRRGWRGINLEPNPRGYERLRRHRPRDVNLPFAVSTSDEERSFVPSGSFGGLDDATHLWPDPSASRITVATRTLRSILDEHLPDGTPIDVLCVDCEGHDLEVLRSNAWDRYRPRLVLAERHAEGDESDPGPYLEQQGYVLIEGLGLTSVYEAVSRR